MTITIGEYTTRNGCRAVVDDNDLVTGLLSGTVILPGNMSQVRVWWHREGIVCFPGGNWSNHDDGGVVFKSDHLLWSIRYSAKTYWDIIAIPSPFDITEPKQMKEETKSVLVQTQRLIKLPNGEWIDPREIVAIMITPPSILDPADRMFWTVDVRSMIAEINIKCPSGSEAQKLADELAEKVNSIK